MDPTEIYENLKRIDKLENILKSGKHSFGNPESINTRKEYVGLISFMISADEMHKYVAAYDAVSRQDRTMKSLREKLAGVCSEDACAIIMEQMEDIWPANLKTPQIGTEFLTKGVISLGELRKCHKILPPHNPGQDKILLETVLDRIRNCCSPEAYSLVESHLS